MPLFKIKQFLPVYDVLSIHGVDHLSDMDRWAMRGSNATRLTYLIYKVFGKPWVSSQQNKSRWPNVGLTMAHRLRRWTNIQPALGQCLVFSHRPVEDIQSILLAHCWAIVCDAGPTLNQQRILCTVWSSLMVIMLTIYDDTKPFSVHPPAPSYNIMMVSLGLLFHRGYKHVGNQQKMTLSPCSCTNSNFALGFESAMFFGYLKNDLCKQYYVILKDECR